MSAWRPALRIAWRDAWRHRARTILSLVMIGLPVLAVSAAALLIKTSDVDGAEKADRVMGASEAFVWKAGTSGAFQAPDPDQGSGWGGGAPVDLEAELGRLLPGTALTPMATGWLSVATDDRVITVSATQVDLSESAAEGLFTLERGTLPQADDEIVVNHAMLDRGIDIGDTLTRADSEFTVVGVGSDATHIDAVTVAGPALDVAADHSAWERDGWLVTGDVVTWDDVRAINDAGGLVSSRSVLADPPDLTKEAAAMGVDDGSSDLLAVVALIGTMALLEVVLLAGPAFAVGARRQSRTIALVAASGGTPAMTRKIVLATGVVIGVLASVVGVVVGPLVGIALRPVVQRLNGQWMGPIEVPLLWLLPIAGFGLLAAVLAAVAPAWIASRQDVVAVLAGRRGDRAPRRRTPVLGLVLFGVGILGSAMGATASGNQGAYLIAGSAVVAVVGMILVAPLVVAWTARLAARLPLSLRFAARDAARHRTRTVPAVAAVAATVAGVVALGIGVASDELQNRETYSPRLAMGAGEIRLDSMVTNDATSEVLDEITAIVGSIAPDVTVTPVVGMTQVTPEGETLYADVQPVGDDMVWLEGDSGLIFADSTEGLGLPTEVADAVEALLGQGRAVVFSAQSREPGEARISVEASQGDDSTWKSVVKGTIPVGFVHQLSSQYVPARAILPTAMASDLGLPSETAYLGLTGDLDHRAETAIEEQAQALSPGTFVYVERGYEPSGEYLIVLWVLAGLGGVLMLGGTLTATFLALSDARPDLATLSAVGAAPSRRRWVAASYALVVGLLGAVLGVIVGLVPGIAVSRPLTTVRWATPEGIPTGPFLDIPWLLILGLVVGLPLVTAAVVGASARSRLPMVARLD